MNLRDPLAWQRNAECRDLPLAESERVFFTGTPSDRLEGRVICSTCPVRDLCLALADDTERDLPRHFIAGTYGGLFAAERVARRERLAQRVTA